jgi:hypothetical protein
MDCSEYVDKFLSAHADGELASRERRLAENHVGGCPACRTRLAEERSLKVLVPQHTNIVKVPAEVRLRIRAAIGEMADPNFIGRNFTAREQDSDRRFLWEVRQTRVWAPIAAAAAVLLFLAVYSGRSGTPAPATQFHPVPVFDLAITKYDSLASYFVPNVPSDRNGSDFAWVMDRESGQPDAGMREDIGRSYSEADMPDDLFNFDPAGYQLSGGRLDRLADGRPVTYTLYRGGGDAILNIGLKDPRMSAPVGAVYWIGMRSFYQYKGYSFCLTFSPPGHFVSITLTRAPLTELIRDVAMADALAIGDDR